SSADTRISANGTDVDSDALLEFGRYFAPPIESDHPTEGEIGISCFLGGRNFWCQGSTLRIGHHEQPSLAGLDLWQQKRKSGYRNLNTSFAQILQSRSKLSV